MRTYGVEGMDVNVLDQNEAARIAYTNAVDFLRLLRKHHVYLSREEVETLRETALKGNILVAQNMLWEILHRKGMA